MLSELGLKPLEYEVHHKRLMLFYNIGLSMSCSKFNCRKLRITHNMLAFRRFTYREFTRNSRSIKHVDHWKATELDAYLKLMQYNIQLSITNLCTSVCGD